MLRTIWIIWLVMVVVIVLADIPQLLTAPNWIEYTTLGGGLTILLGSGARSIWNKWRAEHWYKLYLAIRNPHRPPGQPFDFKRSHSPLESPSTIQVMVTPRGKVSLKRFDIRLVILKHKCCGLMKIPEDAPLDVVKLKDVRLPPNRVTLGVKIPHKERNQAGGLNCVLSEEIQITPSERLLLELDIETYELWVGYVGFRAASLGDREERVYVPLEIRPSPNAGMVNSQIEASESEYP